MSHVLLAVCVLPQSLNPSTLPKVFSARPQPCWCSTSRPRAWSSHPGEEERQSIKKSFKMRAYQQSEEDTWMKIVKTTTMRVVVTKMSAASTTSLVARIQKQESIYMCWPFDLLLPVDHLDEGESDSTPQPPVGHDELLLQVDLLQAEPGHCWLLEWICRPTCWRGRWRCRLRWNGQGGREWSSTR